MDSYMYIRALEFAYDKHKGQFRSDGESYITHPIEVSLKYLDPYYTNWQTRIVAVLHDVLEDTDATFDELNHIFGEDIALCVFLLSKSENLSYEKYIGIIKQGNNPVVTAVKIADLKHNLSTIDNIKDESRRNKLKSRYQKALTVLQG